MDLHLLFHECTFIQGFECVFDMQCDVWKAVYGCRELQRWTRKSSLHLDAVAV